MRKLALYIMMVLAIAGTIMGCNTTEKTPQVELASVENLEGTVFKLGDVFADMSVTTPEGETYVISELLKEKKAVVINFWYLNCGPCQMEFPYLQEAYEQYSEDIEVLAVNPVDGTDEEIADFKAKHELTFPMASCDYQWEKSMGITGYPTTVVIDRYGTVAFIHTGMMTETEEFSKVFAYFTSEDYEQTLIESLDDIVIEETE